MNQVIAPADAFSAEQRAMIRAEHRREEIVTPDDEIDAFCRLCYILDEAWPCTTIRLLDELDEAWAAIERARVGESPA